MLVTGPDLPVGLPSVTALGLDRPPVLQLGRLRAAPSRPSWWGSMQEAKTEGVTCRVQEDPVRRAGLLRVFGRTEVDYCRLSSIEVVYNHIDVHLLGPLLARPRWWRVIIHLMEGDALAGVVASRCPVSGDLDLPIQHRAVEPGECTRIGTVDNDEGHASDRHVGHTIDDRDPTLRRLHRSAGRYLRVSTVARLHRRSNRSGGCSRANGAQSKRDGFALEYPPARGGPGGGVALVEPIESDYRISLDCGRFKADMDAALSDDGKKLTLTTIKGKKREYMRVAD